MKALLVQKGWWRAIETARPAKKYIAPATEAGTTTEDDSEGIKWDEADMYARAEICLRVSDAYINAVAEHATAKAAWTSLQKEHASTSAATILELRRTLMALRLGNATMAAYFAQARTLQANLAAAGDKLSSTDLLMHIYGGLPRAYDAQVALLSEKLRVKDEGEQPSIEDAFASLSLAEARIAAHSDGRSSEHGNALTADGRGRRQGGRGAGGRGGRAEGGSRPPPICWNCDQPGHLSKDCPNPRSTNEYNASKSGGAALSACPARAAASTWVLDSGAASHMTASIGQMDGYAKLAKPHAIYLANGQRLLAIGKGTVTLTHRGAPVTLHDVLHVPGLAYNLLSLPRATALGATVVMRGITCAIRKGKQVVVRATLQHGLWVVNSPVLQRKAARNECAFSAACAVVNLVHNNSERPAAAPSAVQEPPQLAPVEEGGEEDVVIIPPGARNREAPPRQGAASAGPLQQAAASPKPRGIPGDEARAEKVLLQIPIGGTCVQPATVLLDEIVQLQAPVMQQPEQDAAKRKASAATRYGYCGRRSAISQGSSDRLPGRHPRGCRDRQAGGARGPRHPRHAQQSSSSSPLRVAHSRTPLVRSVCTSGARPHRTERISGVATAWKQ